MRIYNLEMGEYGWQSARQAWKISAEIIFLDFHRSSQCYSLCPFFALKDDFHIQQVGAGSMEMLNLSQILKGFKLLGRGIIWLWKNVPWVKSKLSNLLPKATEQAKYAILFLAEDPLSLSTAKYIELLLQQMYQDCNLTLVPWIFANDPHVALNCVKEAQHSLIIVTGELRLSLARKEGKQNSGQGQLEMEIVELAIKQTPFRTHPNESQGTLIFLQEHLLRSFEERAKRDGKKLSAFMLASNEAMDRWLIQQFVPHKHCQLKAPPEPKETSTEVAQTPQKNLHDFFIVPDPGPLFIERNKHEASNLGYLYADFDKKPLQILYGPYGSGKTWIALKYAHQHKERYTSVFWLDAADASLDESIKRTFKEELQLQPASRESWLTCFGNKIKEYEQQKLDETKRWLLVIDGCDYHQNTVNYAYVARLLASRGQIHIGHIILTMRSIPDDFNNRNLAQLRLINHMHKEVEEATFMLICTIRGISNISYGEAFETLRDRIPEHSTEEARRTYWESASTLVRELGYNPSLIYTLGLHMREKTRNLQDGLTIYREYLQQFGQDPLNQQSSIFYPILIVYAIKYSKLQEYPADRALALFMLCIFLNAAPIPRQIIDARPNSNDHQPFYTRIIDKDEDRSLLLDLDLLKGDTMGNPAIYVLRVQKQTRDLMHLLHSKNADERKEHRRYAIHAVSTAFLAQKEEIAENPAQYALYSPHISKCIDYLEDQAVRIYIHSKMPSMLQSIFEFLYTVGTYLQHHPDDESDHVVSEIFEAQREIPMKAEHLFNLAMEIYDLWQAPAGEENPLHIAEMLHAIAHFFHETSLYRDRAGLNVAKDYYQKAAQYVVHTLNPSTPISLSIEHDLGRLYSDLNEYKSAEDQFTRTLTRLDGDVTIPLTPETQLLQAEILLSRATNLTRQGHQNQDNELYAEARKVYKWVFTTLEMLEIDPTIGERAREKRERCQLNHLSLLLCESQWIHNMHLQKEIEQCQGILDKHNPDSVKSMPALTCLQLIVDFNNQAVAYRRLAQQKWRKSIYLKRAIDSTKAALSLHNKFKDLYKKRREQGQLIWQTVRDNYRSNPFYDKNDPITEDLGTNKL